MSQGVNQIANGPFLGTSQAQQTATVNFQGPTSCQGPQTQQQATAFMPPASGQPPAWAYPNQQPPSLPPSDLPPSEMPNAVHHQAGLVQPPITNYFSPSANSAFRPMGFGPDAASPQEEVIRPSGFIWLSNHVFEDVNGGKSQACRHCGIPADYFRLCPGFNGTRAPVEVQDSGDGFSHWLATCHNILKSKKPGDKYSKVHGNGKCQNSGCMFDYWAAHSHTCPRNPNPRPARRAGAGANAHQ